MTITCMHQAVKIAVRVCSPLYFVCTLSPLKCVLDSDFEQVIQNIKSFFVVPHEYPLWKKVSAVNESLSASVFRGERSE